MPSEQPFMKKNVVASFLAAFLCVSQAQPVENTVVVWAANDFSPYSFVSDPYKGQGIVDKAIDLLKKRLPGERYEQTVAPILRVFELMKSQDNLCTGLFLANPEREKFMHFSTLPAIRTLPNGVLITRERRDSLKPYINANGELQLEALLADGKHKLLIDVQRTFGQHIDGILKNPRVQGSIIRTSNAPAVESRLLKLANQNEYDLLIGYAVELRAAAKRLQLNEKDFSFIPIAGESALLPIPISCSKTETGKRYLQSVDKVLSEPGVQREMAKFYREWLDDETALLYDRLISQSLAAK